MPIAEPMNGDGSTRIGVNDIEDAIGVVEMVGPSSITAVDSSSTAESSISICDDDQIAPLLTQSERPKINIFTISYPTRQKLNKVNSNFEIINFFYFLFFKFVNLQSSFTEFSVASSLVTGLVKMQLLYI